MKRYFVVVLGLVLLALESAMAQPQQRQIYRARDRVLPALVHIQPISEVFAAGRRQRTTAIGSGVIISNEGHVVTNYHVVGRVKDLLVTLADKERVSAELVGSDPMTDIAVIKLLPRPGVKLPQPARLGDSNGLEVGEYVMALGSPLALSRSVSLGVVSCVDRYFPDSLTLPTGEPTGRFNTWIQTDAAINPGNSGGPLINLRGEVIGINARMAFFGENVGFAIPIDVVKDVVTEILEHGAVSRSWTGMELQSLEDVFQHFGRERAGALVGSVAPGSPADMAGVQPGDLLLAYNEQTVQARFDEEMPAILKRIADTPVGAEVALRLLRGTESVETSLLTQELGKADSEEFECAAWGCTVKKITRPVALALRLTTEQGVLVTSVAPGTELSGQLNAGDVIEQVGDTAVESLEDFRELYLALVDEEPEQVLLRIRRRAAVRLALVKPTYRRAPVEDMPLAP